MEINQTNSKKSNRGGARPGAGRPKKSNEPLSREDQIKILQDKLKNCSPRHAAAIARRIQILQGVDRPYSKTPSEQMQRDRALADMDGPDFSDDGPIQWWRIRLVEQLASGNLTAAYKNKFDSLTPEEQQGFLEEVERHKQLPKTAEEWKQWDLEHPNWRAESLRSNRLIASAFPSPASALDTTAV